MGEFYSNYVLFERISWYRDKLMGNKAADQLQVCATEFMKKERARTLLSSAWDVAFLF